MPKSTVALNSFTFLYNLDRIAGHRNRKNENYNGVSLVEIYSLLSIYIIHGNLPRGIEKKIALVLKSLQSRWRGELYSV